jgi:hypothetical protein
MREPSHIPQHIPEGEVPTVRTNSTVRGDYVFAKTYALPGVHKAYMNAYGAVSIVAENGELLGLFPSEFEWVSGKPSRWGHGDKSTIYVIEPYEGDWTTDSFYAREASGAST